jgi:GTPase SAR1 family protein
MDTDDEIITFLKLTDRFSKYLNDEANRQIIFTGPFGSGKTTFLRSFFKDQEDYEVIHIFPVNYSLHSNSDICEILKYDLVLELIDKEAFREVDISDFSKYIYATSQVTDNWFGKLLSMFSKTGKNLTDAVDLLEKSESGISQKVKDLSNPLLQIKSLKKIVNKVKSYGYEDYITTVIKTKLLDISLYKKKVLIVDDLDRVDSEHLFRLISVFSAHIDNQTEENKFGFDKIIFVGDLHNFKWSYIHKFGANNNFNAFISKLSSKNPFYFNPSKELYDKIPDLLTKFKFKYSSGGEIFSPLVNFSEFGKKWLSYLICSFVESRIINLRDIQKARINTIIIDNKQIPNLYKDYAASEVYIFSMILNQLLPDVEISHLKNIAVVNPLSIESVLHNERYNLSAVLSELSIIPLSLLKYKEIREKENLSDQSTIDDSITIDNKKLQLEISRHNNSRRTSCSLIAMDANEDNVILLSLHATEVLRKWIKYER